MTFSENFLSVEIFLEWKWAFIILIFVLIIPAQIKRVQHTKSLLGLQLGVVIDENLTWKNRIITICKKISSGIDNLHVRLIFDLGKKK
jgi:hypothetical protein